MTSADSPKGSQVTVSLHPAMTSWQMNHGTHYVRQPPWGESALWGVAPTVAHGQFCSTSPSKEGVSLFEAVQKPSAGDSRPTHRKINKNVMEIVSCCYVKCTSSRCQRVQDTVMGLWNTHLTQPGHQTSKGLRQMRPSGAQKPWKHG